jgi:uncharacterized protein (TIGR02147 family)
LLVEYGQAKKEEERAGVYKALLSRRNRSKFTRLNPSLVKYYQDYRYPLVFCAIEACDFRGNYAMLANYLDPPLPVAEVKRVVRDLCDWGLVTQDTQGHYAVTSKLIEPPETLLHLIREINGEWIKHAYGALRRVPANKRHISSILFSISEENFRLIQGKIDKLRDEVFALIEQDRSPQRVMQLNIQFFPRSQLKTAKDAEV